ncbi:serine--tRNA ligase [Ignatzschineria sp. RMDPL8A]|uniref:serine--tRNA ligase n=1 Tax=Ignatzschineria sp. RMDPL8A TaxID=2999236 RepID=UPI0024465F01|nr:serine--tRNA ligase [Ignatzschineria sp. RMDPL8A]
MIDPRLFRDEIDLVVSELAKRGESVNKEEYLQLESERRSLQMEVESLQSKRNSSAKSIGKAKAQGDDIEPLLAAVADLGEKLEASKTKLDEVQAKLNAIHLSLPNLPHASVPVGKDESENREEKRWGTPREFSFTPKDHVDLCEKRGLNFKASAKLTGSRFVVMEDKIAKLHRALAQFMLNTHTTEHGYVEMNVPVIVNEESLYGTAQLPKFSEDLFKLTDERNYYLIPTSEVPLTNLGRDEIFNEEELPLQVTAHSMCFRSEAGSYGRDTRGMIRQHQFEKVELVHFVKPDDSFDALERLVRHAEIILEKLELPYRRMTLCTGDMGFSAAKTYDLEVWLPGQETYREISSCSNCTDFQARRLKARYKNRETNKNELIHTLNGSGLAVGRTLVAVIENYQEEDGSIRVPEVLKPYMGNLDFI